MSEGGKNDSETANFMRHRGQALVPSRSVNIRLDVAGKVLLDVMNTSNQWTLRTCTHTPQLGWALPNQLKAFREKTEVSQIKFYLKR